MDSELKKIIWDRVGDSETAHKIGEEIAISLMLKRSKEYSDRWETSDGTFTSKGLARRVARFFIES